MSKSSFVIRALSLLGLNEILGLSNVKIPMKKAVGEEILFWDDDFEANHSKHQPEEATVLSFPKKTINQIELMQPSSSGEEGLSSTGIVASELLLLQREISKHSGEHGQKLEAFKGYRKSTEMYVVKTPSEDGKDKIRFAATDGILVNKKQA